MNEPLHTELSTLVNISATLESQMRQKHQMMIEIKNEFLTLQRQYKDLQRIIIKLNEENK